MEIRGEHIVPATGSVVWELLLDPDVLRECLPGCERFEPVAPGEFAVTMRTGVSGLAAVFEGRVRIADEVPPTSYRLLMRGHAGRRRLTGQASLVLSDVPGGTLVRYRSEVRVEGALAQFGLSLFGGAAKPRISRFFEALDRLAARRSG